MYVNPPFLQNNSIVGFKNLKGILELSFIPIIANLPCGFSRLNIFRLPSYNLVLYPVQMHSIASKRILGSQSVILIFTSSMLVHLCFSILLFTTFKDSEETSIPMIFPLFSNNFVKF